MRQRILGADLVRFLSFLAITTHHVSWVYFYTIEIPVAPDSLVVQLYEFYSRCLAFSGFTIVWLTMFLTGLTARTTARRARLLGFLLGGWIFFSAFVAWGATIPLPWDVYPLLLLGLLCLHGFEKLGPAAVRGAALVGIFLLWIPFWDFSLLKSLPVWIGHVIVGDCTRDVAEWAILPWLGLVWFGYGFGYELKSRGIRGPCTELRLRGWEWIIWPGLLALSLPRLGAYFSTPLGEEFACYVYRRPPPVLWSHLVWPIWLVRLSLDDRVQKVLERSHLVRWISQLAISRKFWLAYVVHYPFAYVIAWVARDLGAPQSRYHPQWVAFVAIVYLPLTEMICRILLSTVEWWKSRRRLVQEAA